MKNKIDTYSLSQVSQMTGVSKNRIREWHVKGLLSQVEWIPGGTRDHRRFSQDDIKVITKIGEYQRQGLALKAAAEKAIEK
jgi:DNA-binding transcriptional MerR regulator